MMTSFRDAASADGKLKLLLSIMMAVEMMVVVLSGLGVISAADAVSDAAGRGESDGDSLRAFEAGSFVSASGVNILRDLPHVYVCV